MMLPTPIPAPARMNRGFSLVEVTVALGIAAFALIAIFGLVPIGLNTTQQATEQSAAAVLARAVVADLRGTNWASAAVKSPLYKLELGDTAGAQTLTFFAHEDGTLSGEVNADAVAAEAPRYRVTLTFTNPPAARPLAATHLRLLITWPALADPTAANAPAKYTGSYEVLTALDRH